MKLKRLIATIITLCLTAFLIIKAGQFLDPAYMDGCYDQIKAFHELPENSVDAIIYGTSHAWKGVDSRVINDKYGVSCYNYACNWQCLNTSELFIKDSLYTQSPKYIILDTYNQSVLRDTNMVGEVYYTRYLPNTQARKDYLEECFVGDKGRYFSYYVPLVALHDSWENITSENFIPLDDGVNTYISDRGYAPSDVVFETSIGDYTQFEQLELKESAEPVYEELATFCRENDIQLILITIPATKEPEYNYFDAFTRFADSHENVTYLNLYAMDEEHAINPLTDFQDDDHLNSSGAYKVGDYLGKYLTTNF